MNSGAAGVGARPQVTAPGSPALQAIDFARRAPSIHNTQPWLWRVRGERLDLYADRRRQLHVTDPSGRNLTISCGAALAHAKVAAGAVGWRADALAPDPADRDHLAALALRPGRATPDDQDDHRLLAVRQTDRRRFTSWPIPPERLDRLLRGFDLRGVSVVSVTDRADRLRLELLVGQALHSERTTPGYLEEQAQWMERGPWDGVPVDAVGDEGQRSRRPSRFDEALAPDVQDQVRATDGILVLCADTDEPTSWLRIGELLCRLWTRAMREGLSVVPLSQVVEIDETRETLRHQFLDGTRHPELLVRIGWQEIARSPLPPTPRRPLSDILLG
jgi:nitroreductase